VNGFNYLPACAYLFLVSNNFHSKRFFSTEQNEAIKEAEVTKEEEVKAVPQTSEKTVGTAKKHEFQAETKKILDIVVRSLYTDREVSFCMFIY
jgi:TNF receptor-associated protein 1